MKQNRLSRITIQKILCVVDILAAFFSIWLALFVRNLAFPSFEYWWQHVLYFLPFFFFGICTLYLEGFYVVTKPIRNYILIIKLGMIGLLGCLFGFVYFYFTVSALHFPKIIMILFWLIFCMFVFITRKIFFLIVFLRLQIPVIFLGDTISYEDLKKDLIENPMFGYKPVFLYKGIDDKNNLLTKIQTEYKDENVLFVYKLSSHILDGLSDVLKTLIAKGNQFVEYSDFYEYIERKIPPEDIDESWFLSNIALYRKYVYFMFKRLLDIFFSLIGLVFTIWLWPLIAVLIHIDSNGPVFFVQEREGREGKIFNLLKFRTMKSDKEQEKSNDITIASSKNRVTRIGRILRACRLDELPQFLNVLKGDMSLIGPRPERPELATLLEKSVPWYRQRLLVRPGITGWDQVCGEYHSPTPEDTFKKLQNDLYYIKNCSIALDISIAFKTVGTVFRREGK